jgi:hypothetical protein
MQQRSWPSLPKNSQKSELVKSFLCAVPVELQLREAKFLLMQGAAWQLV